MIEDSKLSNKELEMIEDFIRLGISESSSEDILEYGYLQYKVMNILRKLN